MTPTGVPAHRRTNGLSGGHYNERVTKAVVLSKRILAISQLAEGGGTNHAER
jgi:hypothetical protein